jgi:hypothetical protein
MKILSLLCWFEGEKRSDRVIRESERGKGRACDIAMLCPRLRLGLILAHSIVLGNASCLFAVKDSLAPSSSLLGTPA